MKFSCPCRMTGIVMADHLSPERRSWAMSRVRSKNTSAELRVRSLLHRSGYRYRLHVRGMAGKPDIVLPKYRTVIFVNGCFWHRHQGCPRSSTPKSNTAFWLRKFELNKRRDQETVSELQRNGWDTFTIWECQTKNAQTLENLVAKILPTRNRSLETVTDP